MRIDVLTAVLMTGDVFSHVMLWFSSSRRQGVQDRLLYSASEGTANLRNIQN